MTKIYVLLNLDKEAIELLLTLVQDTDKKRQLLAY